MALSATGNVNTSIENLDVLVVGAGFAGLYQLHCLRKKGYKVKVVDSAAELGGYVPKLILPLQSPNKILESGTGIAILALG